MAEAYTKIRRPASALSEKLGVPQLQAKGPSGPERASQLVHWRVFFISPLLVL